MIQLFGFVGSGVLAFALYTFCAALVCLETNPHESHAWCPLCQVALLVRFVGYGRVRVRRVRRLRHAARRRNS